jgi:mRNA deadenylase 3'-5' endonuclease subunit Ccr4
MTVSLVTYNILADSYIRPKWFPYTPAECLDPAIRHPALLAELVAMDSDIFALQEVERDVFDLLSSGLEPLGYIGRYGPKGRDKPDGCATFVRQAVAQVIEWQRLEFSDAVGDGKISGHVALIALLEVDGQRLGVANTHLKWAAPGTPRTEHLGSRQIDELAEVMRAHSCAEWVVCGDFNCIPDSDVLDSLRETGFVDAHGEVEIPTCNANRDARKLDHVFITGGMTAEPAPIAPIDGHTPLPSEEHASDHLPVKVALCWRKG